MKWPHSVCMSVQERKTVHETGQMAPLRLKTFKKEFVEKTRKSQIDSAKYSDRNKQCQGLMLHDVSV